ncbi:MAG: LamG domain-containing protein, partial [Desulfobacteraceae bacterium]|nr:LamG domain-containing protein [Desulfobacteraceae bacterium]
TNNNLVLEWTYDATPADAFARMTTWGYANDFYIDAKVLSLQTNNSAGQVGIGTDDPQAKLDVRGDFKIGDWTSPDVYLTGVPASGGDFNIQQTSGAGKIKFVSNAGTDLITIQNDGDMGIGKVPTEKLDVNGTAQATILKANNGILDSSETEGDILAITGDSLTAGTAISINSLSSSDILRNLIEIRHSGTGDSTSAIDINLGDSNGTVLLGSSSNTTQPGVRVDCNDLTYGAVAHFASSSADTNIRKLVHIQNSNVLSTGTTGLVIDQASTGKAISTNGNITAGSYDGVLNDGVTATTQSTDDNSTKVATTAYADNVVSSEVYGSQDGQVLSIDFSQVGITTQYDKGPLVNNATGTSAGLVTSTGGAFGSGAVLNGTADYFTLSNSTGLPTGANVRTIEAYVKIDDITLQSGVIFRYGTETGDDVFSLEQIDAALRIFTNDDSSDTGNILSEGDWFLIQATYNGTQVNMWVNGVKVITNDAITINTASGTTPYIGSRGGSSDYYDGNIDFVRVYDRVLTDDEIKVSYLRSGGESVITSNAAKIVNTSGESRNIAGLDPAYAVDVFSLTDLPTAVAGVITLEAKMYVFHNIIVFSDRLVIPDDSTTILKMSEYGFNTYLLYTGTGTFITGSSNAGLRIIDASIGMTGTGAKCFDVNGTVGIDFVSIICLGTSQTLGTLAGEAVDARTGNGRFVARRSDFIDYDGGLTLTNLEIAVIDQVNFKQNSSSTSSSIKIEGALSNPSAITSAVFSTGASGSCIDISPTIQSAISVNQSHNTGTGDYFTPGTTGTYTAVADASIGATSVTSVTNPSGTIARFNYTGSTVYQYQVVVLSTFSNYTNGTYTISNVGSGYFEIDAISYNGADTGSFLSNSITLTDTGTSLVDGNTILIDTDGSADYDGGSYVYNKQTNTVQVNIPEGKTWQATETGTWNTGSLTQDSKYINANGNGDEEDSHNTLFAYVNTNSTTTTFSLANTWYTVELGTVVEGLETSRFKYIGDNTFKITTLAPLMGVFEANLTGVKTGSDKAYDFRINLTSGTGSFDSVIKAHTISTGVSSFPVKASGFLQPGDEFQIEARVASTSQSEMTISGFNGEFD